METSERISIYKKLYTEKLQTRECYDCYNDAELIDKLSGESCLDKSLAKDLPELIFNTDDN